MKLLDESWEDAAAAETEVAVLPVGSTEQHGPHAALGTDVVTAEAVATAGVDRYSDTAVLAPTIPVGVAAEHRQFAGTLWVTEETLRAYVRETIESLAYHGWDRVVVVNGHGGNVAALRELCGNLTREESAYTVPFTWFDAVDLEDLGTSMGHGGPAETSLLQYVAPELVGEDSLDDAGENSAAGWGEWQSGTNLAYDSVEFTENGVVGDPRAASSELGEAILDASADALASLLDVVATRDTTRPSSRSD